MKSMEAKSLPLSHLLFIWTKYATLTIKETSRPSLYDVTIPNTDFTVAQMVIAMHSLAYVQDSKFIVLGIRSQSLVMQRGWPKTSGKEEIPDLFILCL